MEALILLSYYDERWFFLGLPERFGIWSLHKDSVYSSTLFFCSYIQVQFIAYAYYLNKDNEFYMKGLPNLLNPLEDGPFTKDNGDSINPLLIPFSN
jgi:hypothetical protein